VLEAGGVLLGGAEAEAQLDARSVLRRRDLHVA